MQKKSLHVPFMTSLTKTSDLIEISATLNKLEPHKINIAPWSQYDYLPDVTFTIAHANDCIFLKYYVREAVVKAEWYYPNDPVFKDSCVEFFIAFGNDANYYNCEFNVIGTCKLNHGREREQRKRIAEKHILLVNYLATIQNKNSSVAKSIHWDLTLMIPIVAFSENKIQTLSGETCRGNFFKCGDDLPEPHFVAWNNVNAPSPNFHVPECFGEILFD
jgi:hypothetical protein